MPVSLRILIVEDTPTDAELMLLRLRNEGYQIVSQIVQTEAEYLLALEDHYDLILSDWSLPQFSGLRALQLLRQRGLDTPFIIVSGSIGEEAAVDAMHQGAYDYLLKDRSKRLGQAVNNALERKKLLDERKKAEDLLLLQSMALNAAANAIVITDRQGMIEWANPAFTTLTGYAISEVINKNPRDLIKSGKQDQFFYSRMWDTILSGAVWRGEMINRRKDGQVYTEELTITPIPGEDGQISRFVAIREDISKRKETERLLLQTTMELQTAYDATLQGWSNALELREHETAGHSQRVVLITLELAGAMGISAQELVHVQRGALLHDIGKMGIPDSILLKPGPLSDDEWTIMRRHPVHAYHLLKNISFLAPAMDIPYSHHERWDGSGYPQGLKGSQIPLIARIFAVVDVWDALSHDRPYRRAWTKEAVFAYLQEQSGKQFDPQVVNKFLSLQTHAA